MSTGSRRDRRLPRRGFTMIEIIVVVVIIAVLSGMAVLSLQGQTASAALRASAGDLLRFAQYGRDYAITRGTTCRLVIDAPQRRFYLEHESNEDGTQPGTFNLITADTMRPRTLPRGVDFGLLRIEPGDDGSRPQAADTSMAITFSPLGDANAAAIEVTDGRHSFTVRIAPATGRAEVMDGRVETLLSDRMDLDA